jgi:hypothetical protein
MALEKQQIPLILGHGKLDTNTSDRLLPADGLTEVYNLVQGQAGAWETRHGFGSLGTTVNTGSIASAKSLTALQDRLLLETDDSFFAYASQPATWYYQGAARRVAIAHDGAFSRDRRMHWPSCAYNGGYVCTVAQSMDPAALTTPTIYLQVQDYVTGTLVLSTSITGWLPKVIAIGSSFHLYYLTARTGAGQTIACRRIQTSAPATLGAAVTVSPTLYTMPVGYPLCYDVALGFPSGLATTAQLIYPIPRSGPSNDTIGWTTVTEAQATTNWTGGPVATMSFESITAIGWMSSPSTESSLYAAVACHTNLGGAGTNAVYHLRIAPGTPPTWTRTTVGSGALTWYHSMVTGYRQTISGTTYDVIFMVASDDVARAAAYALCRQAVSSGGAAFQIANVSEQAQPIARPQLISGTHYLTWAYLMAGPSYQGTYFVTLDQTFSSSGTFLATYPTYQPVARILPSEGGCKWDDAYLWGSAPTIEYQGGTVGAWSAISATKYVVGLLRANDIPDGSWGALCTTIDFAPTGLSAPAVMADVAYVPGGYVRAFDGSAVVEQSFPLAPEAPTITATTGGSLTAPGTYQYRCAYRWTDAQGNVYRSAPSPATSVSIAAPNNAATIDVRPIFLTDKASPAIEIYRTLAGGTTFYKVTMAGQNSATPSVYPLPITGTYPAPTYASTPVTDISSDTNLATYGELLYTTGGVLETAATPTAKQIFAGKNRLWLTGTDDPHEAWYSKTLTRGEGLSFGPDQVLRVDDEFGGFAGGAQLDDNIILFKDHAIYVVTGDGPDDTGVGSFSEPRRLADIHGCSNPRSICVTPAGVMFEYDDRLYLLDRSLTTQPVGLPVATYTAAADVVGVVPWPEGDEVWHFLGDEKILVYNYTSDQWSVCAHRLGESFGSWAATTTWLHRITGVKSTGTVYFITTSTTLDDTNIKIPVYLTTGRVALNQIEGLQRIYAITIAGEAVTPCVITASLWHDGATSSPETWSSGALSAGPFSLVLKPNRQKCTDFRLKIASDGASVESSGHAGPRIISVTVTGGMKPGRRRDGTTIVSHT